MAKVNIRESLGRLDLLTDNKYDLRNTYDSSNISNDKKKKLAESISNNASAKQIYNILNETFNEDGINVTGKISDDVRDGMFGGLIGKDTEWEVFFESGPTDILDSDMEDMANDILNGRLSGKTNNGVGWQIRVRYGDDYYDYNCLNCPEDDYVGSRWEEYDESLNEEDNFNSDEYERKHILRLAKSVEEASKRKGMNIDNLKKTTKRYIENHKDTKNKKELDMLIKVYKSLDEKEECFEEDYDEKKSVEFADYWVWAKTKDGKWKMYDAVSSEEDVKDSQRNAKADKRFVDVKVTKNGKRPDGNHSVLTSESLTEDTIKQNGKWVNKGEEGTHGKFKTKKVADAQRKAMFANGYKGESLKEDIEESLKESAFDSDEYEREHILRLAKAVKEASKGADERKLSNLKKTAKKYLTNHKGTKHEKEYSVLQKAYDSLLDEDWEPDEWEETDFLDNDGKKVYINIIKEAEDIDDLKDIAHDLYWHDKGLFAMLRNFPKDKSFEWIQNRMIEVIKSTMNESLTEKLVDAPQEIVDKVISILNNNGFVIDESLSQPIRKTYRGTHVQVINEDSFVDVTADEDEIYDQLEKYIPDEMTNEIDSFRERYGVPVTWNFGVNTDGKVTGGLDIYKQYVPDSNESLNEDTYTTNEINKFIRRAMSMANIMKKDFYVVETYIEDGTQFNGYAVTAKVDPQDKAIVKASYKDGKVSIKKLKNESLTEASYGGAYDIEDDMFWTKDDLIEFSDAVCEKLADKFGYQYDIADVGAESNNDMYITIMDTTHDIEADVSFRIKMSRIRSPRDLMKYLDTVVSQFVKKFEEEYQYYDFDESLNEDISKPDFVVGFYAGPVDDETLELVNPKKISQVDVSADELRARYGKTVDKLLNDYTSQTVDKLKNGNSTLKAMILNFAEKKARETGELDNKFRNEERKFLDTGIYMDSKLEEINYPFEDGIKKLSKQLGKMLLPKRESLTEDVYDEESDFGDGSVEEGDTFIEDGRTWSWIERIAGPVHLDFDNWAVWSARDWDYIEEKVKPLLVNKEEFNVEVLTKIYDEAEVAYFVVDEDTGFIDWGPVETQTEAQDFLNGKVEDWENDDEYDESLKESKQLKESSDITDNGYSYTLHYEDIGDGKEYDYEVSSDEMFNFLNVISWENGDGPEDINREDHEQWDNWVANNINDLIKKYEDDILDNFREDASQEEYDNRDSDDREFDY